MATGEIMISDGDGNINEEYEAGDHEGSDSQRCNEDYADDGVWQSRQ